MKYLAIAALATLPLAAETEQCTMLHSQRTLEGKVHDSCRDSGMHIHGCYVELLADGRSIYVTMNGSNPLKKEMHGKKVKISGDYFPNYWTYLGKCNDGKPFLDGEPDSLLRAQKVEDQ